MIIKKNKISMYVSSFLMMIIIVVVSFLIYAMYVIFFDKDKLVTNASYNLKKDGLCVLKNIFTANEMEYFKNECNRDNYKIVKERIISNPKMQSIIKNKIGNDYDFQDYIFIIKKSAIHTCHRDGNGDFFNEKQKYPSYTMLLFLEDMDKCLGVIPQSHKDVNSFNFNFTERVSNVVCNKGDIILFNANLIHVGALNSRDDNLRIQMKITHKHDIPVMDYYNNYNKILNEDNNMPFYVRKLQQKLSCMFPVLSNYTQKEVQTSSEKSKTAKDISIAQKIYSYVMYGNSNFYNLPNAF
jgi:hypothetical protein